jgi:hypothetical protein
VKKDEIIILDFLTEMFAKHRSRRQRLAANDARMMKDPSLQRKGSEPCGNWAKQLITLIYVMCSFGFDETAGGGSKSSAKGSAAAAAPASSNATEGGTPSKKRGFDLGSMSSAKKGKGSTPNVKVESKWSPAKKLKETVTVIYLVYALIGEMDEVILISVIIFNCYDRYSWLKGLVDYNGEMCGLSGWLELLYPATRRRRWAEAFENFVAAILLPGTEAPNLLRSSSPLWIATALDSDPDVLREKSAKLEEFVVQFENILPGSPDVSNNATFRLSTVRVQCGLDPNLDDQTGELCEHMMALMPPSDASA